MFRKEELDHFPYIKITYILYPVERSSMQNVHTRYEKTDYLTWHGSFIILCLKQ